MIKVERLQTFKQKDRFSAAKTVWSTSFFFSKNSLHSQWSAAIFEKILHINLF